MGRKENKNLICLTGMAVLSAMLFSGCGEKKEDLDSILNTTISYESNLLKEADQGAAYGNEWTVIGLARSPKGIEEEQKEAYLTSLAETVDEQKGILSDRKYTEYSRTILAVTSLGEDPSDVGGYDLAEALLDHDKVASQGLNGPIFALLALQSAGQSDAEVTGEYVQDIMEAEMDQGGFAFSDTSKEPDPDMTAMALQALIFYQNTEGVSEVIQRGVQVLADIQNEKGGYIAWGEENSESTAQVIIALSALNIDSNTDVRFQKDGKGLLDRLLEFRKKDGSFSHLKDGDTDQIATDQALCALDAYECYQNGSPSFYDMNAAESGI